MDAAHLLWNLTGGVLGGGTLVAFAYLTGRAISRCKLFQDAPDAEAYGDVIEIPAEGRSGQQRLSPSGGRLGSNASPTVTHTHDGGL